MDSLASAFDSDPNSEEHRRLAESAWLGGAFVEVQYYLGRLLRRNLFREPYGEVYQHLISFMEAMTSSEGARLLADEGDWSLPVPLLRFRFESELLGNSKQKPREVIALEEFFKKPSITPSELARKVGTTETQLSRMAALNYAGALPYRTQSQREVLESRTSGITSRKHPCS